ncbi:MAG: response regulator transcription factor, partial [Cyanobacteria bacterium P01_A01_bin.114]
MKAHVLIIEGDLRVGHSLSTELLSEGYRTSLFREGKQGLMAAQQLAPELILLSWELPGLPGLDVVRQLRARYCTAQIILISHKHDLRSCILGLDAGANDYICRPLRMAELLARVRARLRRVEFEKDLSVLRFDDLRLDQKSRECYRGQELIMLTAKEFELLRYFMKHPRIVLTRQQILASVWGYVFEGKSNVIEVLIFSLRRKLGVQS